jgi:hypothetical protein
VKRIRPLRSLAILASLPVFALLFWMTALLVSNRPGLLAVGVNGLSLANYAGDSGQRPAPLSLRVLQDAQQDAGGGPGASLALATPNPTPSGSVEPTPSHTASPTPAPSPTPRPLPLPTPTPTPGLPLLPPVATPTPTPGLLPLPLTSILPLPILPSLLPGLVK